MRRVPSTHRSTRHASSSRQMQSQTRRRHETRPRPLRQRLAVIRRRLRRRWHRRLLLRRRHRRRRRRRQGSRPNPSYTASTPSTACLSIYRPLHPSTNSLQSTASTPTAHCIGLCCGHSVRARRSATCGCGFSTMAATAPARSPPLPLLLPLRGARVAHAPTHVRELQHFVGLVHGHFIAGSRRAAGRSCRRRSRLPRHRWTC